MIHLDKIDWSEVSKHSQRWVSIEDLRKSVEDVISSGESMVIESSNPNVKIVVTSEGVSLYSDSGDFMLNRKLSVVNAHLEVDFGLCYTKSKSKENGRSCPKCNGIFRHVPINDNRSELTCRNIKCGYNLMESKGKGKVIYTEWSTGKRITL